MTPNIELLDLIGDSCLVGIATTLVLSVRAAQRSTAAAREAKDHALRRSHIVIDDDN